MYAYGLWHYSTTRDGSIPYFFFDRLYSTLEGAKKSATIKKNASICAKLPNSHWFIVPVEYAFQRPDKIKYQLSGESWTRDIDPAMQAAFTKKRA